MIFTLSVNKNETAEEKKLRLKNWVNFRINNMIINSKGQNLYHYIDSIVKNTAIEVEIEKMKFMKNLTEPIKDQNYIEMQIYVVEALLYYINELTVLKTTLNGTTNDFTELTNIFYHIGIVTETDIKINENYQSYYLRCLHETNKNYTENFELLNKYFATITKDVHKNVRRKKSIYRDPLIIHICKLHIKFNQKLINKHLLKS